MFPEGRLPGVKLDVFFPGFPTLQHLPHTARLGKESVRVFEQTSRGENMMLVLAHQGRPDIELVARELIGKEVSRENYTGNWAYCSPRPGHHQNLDCASFGSFRFFLT